MPEKYGITFELKDFNQEQFEIYQPAAIAASKRAYTEFESGTGITATAVVRGETVRAAISAGILSGIKVEEVGKLKPYIVTWIADEVRDHVKKVVSEPIDPN